MSKKLVFFTNVLSHYQLSLSREFLKIYGSDYCVVVTERFPEEMTAYGVSDLNQQEFVIRTYDGPESEREALELAEDSECLIFCGIPAYVEMSLRRAQKGKLTFEYSERLFKRFGLKQLLWILAARFSPFRRHALKRRLKNQCPPSQHLYLLCSGAFVPFDYRLCGYYRDCAYRWGYFPETKYYDDVEELISRKEPASILWAGRCIDWKHPELAILLAKNLKSQNIPFHLRIIGQGSMSQEVSRMVSELELHDCVEILGALPPEKTRGYMERSQIFLFTSDRNEGWGCVLNESMNSACAVLAGSRIGAVPYLVKDNHNGIIFRDKNLDDLTQKVKDLLSQPERISELGRSAYETITSEWSPRVAAERFVKLSESLSRNHDGRIFPDGPCSPAPVIRDTLLIK